MQYFKPYAMHNTFHYIIVLYYIVQAEKHTALPNQRYLWFASMDFPYFFHQL